MNKLLTVVVPVYKVERYINKCLDSLILPDEQMDLVEVIVVNDGTPDQSAVMAKEYERRFPNSFRVIDKENGGHGSAWNRGVAEATGKYLRFLDSDDWLTNLSEFIELLKDCDSDLVFTDLRCCYENTNKEIVYENHVMEPNHQYYTDTFDWEKHSSVYTDYNVTNFHKCTYKTRLLKELHPLFVEKIFYDDEILFVAPLCVAKTFISCNLILYNYLLGREGQTMDHKVMLRNINFKLQIRKYVLDYYSRQSLTSPFVKAKIESVLQSRSDDTTKLISGLSYTQSKELMRDVSSYMEKNHPYLRKGASYRLYDLSFSIWWLLYHYARPIWQQIRAKVVRV